VPRTAAGDVVPQDWALTPQDGLLNIFPSTLYHRVEPHRSDKHRYAFAFDIRSPDIGIPLHDGMHLANWRWTYFFGPMLALKWCETKVRKLLGS
jgi:Putative 2OG-Fe(II) oxygenase